LARVALLGHRTIGRHLRQPPSLVEAERFDADASLTGGFAAMRLERKD